MITPAQRAARFGRLDWQLIDLTNQRFGKLRVLHRDGTDISGHVRWHCLCECGSRKVVSGTSLRLGCTISCGCFMRECTRALRLTGLSRRRARSLMAALENEIGADRLDRILSTSITKPKTKHIG